MRSLLAKIAIRKFVGLYLGEHEVSASLVAVTPLGPVEIVSHSEPCQPSDLLGTIEKVVNSLQGSRRRRLQVAIGLPNSRVFFGTRPLRSGADATPEAVIQKLLCSSNVTTDDLTIDMIKSNVEKTAVATVGACRKKYMAAVLGVLQQCGAQVIRTEPAPCALVRAAARRHHPPRRAKTLLRIFLGADDGLAVLTVAGLPLAWRSFAMPSFSEGMAILSAARTLLSQSQYYEMSTPLDYAIVHGRPDLHDRLQKEGLPTEIGARMIWHDDPAFGGATIALGLAFGCLNQVAPAFDLSRTMKPRPSLRDIFPWGELACECTLMALMSLVVVHHSERLNSVYLSVQSECEGNKILASADVVRLEKEKVELTKKLDSLHKFIDSRVVWTTYTRGISTLLPANIQINNWDGSSALSAGGKGQGLKSLKLAAIAPLTADGAIPPEVGKFVKLLRTQPLLKRDFSDAELTGIRPTQAKGSKAGQADFTIVCNASGSKKKGGK
jgi:hypothetical protein